MPERTAHHDGVAIHHRGVPISAEKNWQGFPAKWV
jgi:hypothetical protein